MSIKNQQPFFAHDANSRNNDKMIRLRMRHGVSGYGVYYMLLERLRCSDTFSSDLDYEVLAYDLDCDKDLIRSVVEDFDLFEIIEDGSMFHCVELTEKMQAMLEAKRKRQEMARRAAEARWGKLAGCSTDAPSEESFSEEYKMGNSSTSKESKLISELNNMKADKSWCEAIKNEFGLSDQKLFDYIEAFHANCICNGQLEHVSYSDTVKHCRSYIRKMIGKEDESRTKCAVPDKLSKEETQRLKEFNRRHEESINRNINSKDNSQSGDNVYRNFGYDPSCCSIRDLFDPGWRNSNPPTHPEWIGRFSGRETVDEVEQQLNMEMELR